MESKELNSDLEDKVLLKSREFQDINIKIGNLLEKYYSVHGAYPKEIIEIQETFPNKLSDSETKLFKILRSDKQSIKYSIHDPVSSEWYVYSSAKIY